MLVIRRANGEDVIIQHNGETLILSVRRKGRALDLAFSGPKSFRILRRELNDKRSGEHTMKGAE